VDCADHPGVPASACAGCAKGVCDTCATYDVDGRLHCETCGRDAEDKSKALGSALLALVGVGYLAALAVGVLVFRAKPFVGGIAAIVAIALGRALQIYMRPPVVTRRLRQSG
jgi:hypothetical protein